MPIYEYKCSCGRSFEKLLAVADYNEPQSCKCGETAQRQISRPLSVKVQPDLRYRSPIDGRVITTHRLRNEDLERNGCIPYEKGMREDTEARLRRSDLELDHAIDETLESEIERMPDSKREALQNELISADIEFTRN